MHRPADFRHALVIACVRVGVGAGEGEPIERPELAGDFDALPRRLAGEIVDARFVLPVHQH